MSAYTEYMQNINVLDAPVVAVLLEQFVTIEELYDRNTTLVQFFGSFVKFQ